MNVKKFQSKKGFTLVEMLIVVAIIAILIAIAIPIISATLEKAREAVDEGNWRSAISLGNAYYLTTALKDLPGNTADNITKTYANPGIWVYFDINDNKEGYITTTKPTKGYGQGTAIGAVAHDLTDCVLAIHIQNPKDDAAADGSDWSIVEAVWVDKDNLGSDNTAIADTNIVYNPGYNDATLHNRS